MQLDCILLAVQLLTNFEKVIFTQFLTSERDCNMEHPGKPNQNHPLAGEAFHPELLLPCGRQRQDVFRSDHRQIRGGVRDQFLVGREDGLLVFRRAEF